MGSSRQIYVKAGSSGPPSPQQIIERYSNPLDCLTAHLMLECSEVMAGIKPANLVSIVNRTRPCGRNLYHLWQSHHRELSKRIANLSFTVLKDKPQAMLLLCYDNYRLERQLAHAGIRVLLKKAGYACESSCDGLVAELQRRITGNDSFPHEIGLFIGYPAKDVAAFMGLVKLPFACQGPWKIYGNPAQSLDLAEQYRCCRQRMNSLLASGDRTALELANTIEPFFCRQHEIDCHYPTGVPAFNKPIKEMDS
ncbi:MAG: DUF3793 family protein [Geobacteraceae bacterium]|nr:DUF3793 family protein [Geobacteraceae bacterium]